MVIDIVDNRQFGLNYTRSTKLICHRFIELTDPIANAVFKAKIQQILNKDRVVVRLTEQAADWLKNKALKSPKKKI